MKTEQRPKLLRDWPSPFRETIPAGTIATVCADARADARGELYGFTRPDGAGVDECLREWEMRDCPDWFEWVTVCLTCQREVCKTHERTGACRASTASDVMLCHGHDEPKPDVEPPRPELTCLSICGECDMGAPMGIHRLLDFEVDSLARLSDGSLACSECGNSVEAYSAYACCIHENEPLADEPKSEPPYPNPEVANYQIAYGTLTATCATSHWCSGTFWTGSN